MRYPAFLQDGAQAVAWAVNHSAEYGADPKQLYVMGHSSGAYNAAMLALDGRWLKAVGLAPSIFKGWIGLAGPYDFLPIENQDVRPVFFFPDSPSESQPINHVSHDAPPSLLIASTDDTLVNPTRNTGGLAKKLRDAGGAGRGVLFHPNQPRDIGRVHRQAVALAGAGAGSGDGVYCICA